MPRPITIRGDIEEGDDLWTVLRPVGPDDNVVFLADVDDFDFALYRVRKGSGALTAEYSQTSVSVSTGNPGSAAVMFGSLQVDSWWEEDDIGYSFRHGILATTLTSNNVFMQGGQLWLLEYKLNTNLTNTTQVFFPHLINVLPRRIS